MVLELERMKKKDRLKLALADMCKSPYPTAVEVAKKYGITADYVLRSTNGAPKKTYSQALKEVVDVESEYMC